MKHGGPASTTLASALSDSCALEEEHAPTASTLASRPSPLANAWCLQAVAVNADLAAAAVVALRRITVAAERGGGAADGVGARLDRDVLADGRVGRGAARRRPVGAAGGVAVVVDADVAVGAGGRELAALSVVGTREGGMLVGDAPAVDAHLTGGARRTRVAGGARRHAERVDAGRAALAARRSRSDARRRVDV